MPPPLPFLINLCPHWIITMSFLVIVGLLKSTPIDRLHEYIYELPRSKFHTIKERKTLIYHKVSFMFQIWRFHVEVPNTRFSINLHAGRLLLTYPITTVANLLFIKSRWRIKIISQLLHYFFETSRLELLCTVTMFIVWQ